MGSGGDIADPLSGLSQFLGQHFDDVDSDTGKLEILGKFSAFLNESEAISSSVFPYKALGAFIEQILPGPSPSITLEAAHLYLLLLEKVSVAYNELTFSSCLHHSSRIAKEGSAKSRGGKNSKTTISTTSGSVQITDYVRFWSKLTALFTGKVLSPGDANVATFTLQSFGDLIRYGNESQVLDAAVSGISNMVTNSANFATISSLYKLCIPIARLPLLSANRKALIAVILTAAASEQKLNLTSKRRSSFAAPRPNGCDEMDEVDEGKEEAYERNEDAREAPSLGDPSTEARYPVLRFLELCCLNVSERSDHRTSTAKFVHQVVSQQSSVHISGFQRFLQRSSRSPKATVRMLTIELAATMIQDAQVNTSTPVSTTGLLEILQARSQDRMPTVRCKAMHLLTESLKSIPNGLGNPIERGLLKGLGNMTGRLRDEKARVRKSATEYVGHVCRADIAQHSDSSETQRGPEGGDEMGVDSEQTSSNLDLFSMLDLLRQRCRDASAIVRQTAAEELSESLLAAIQYLEGNDVQKCFDMWADGVLHQVEDSDQRCRDIAVEKASVVAFSGFEESQMNSGSDTVIPTIKLSNLFLSHIGGENQSAANYGRKVTMVLCKNGKLGPKVIDSLCKNVKFDQPEQVSLANCGAWIALEAIARSGKARDVKRKLGRELLEKELNSGNAHAFGISLQLTRSMDVNNRSSMADSVRQTLFPSQKTKVSSLSSQSIYAALQFLASLQNDAGEDLLEQCEGFILDCGGDFPDSVTSHVLQVVGSICAVFKLRKEPPDALLHFVEASASQVQTSSKIRALAISTLGKMCLCESSQEVSQRRSGAGLPPRKTRRIMSADRIGEALTRRFVALFVRELEHATSSATRNNAVIVLCDLCRRYTSVVEPFVSRLAGLLTDTSEFVRVQVISSLVSLLQEDYIKIRTGPLLYQIAKCLLDASETVRATAEYAVLQVIVQKNASILASSFIELVFVLNACTACSTYNQFPSEMQAASLKSFEKCDYNRRLVIYEVFLRGMSGEQRIRLPSRLRSDVLTLIVDEKLLLTDPSVASVLDDTINLLTVGQLCNFSAVKGSGCEENGVESATIAEESQTQSPAGGNVLIQKVQALELRESTIPVLLELRKQLERLRSPILKSLMRALCTLLRPHRTNLETMIGDPLVRAEVAHEIAKPLRERQQELRSRARQKTRSLMKTVKGTGTTSEQETPIEEAAVPSTPRVSARKPPLERPSVPRSKRTMRKSRIAEEEENGEDDDDIEMASSCRRLSMMDRICESPKLVALVRRGSAAGSGRQGRSAEHNGTSLFATTMARIEGEAKS